MKNSGYRHSSLLEGDGEENNQESVLIHVFPENKCKVLLLQACLD